MKKQLLFYLLIFNIVVGFSQTFPIHDIDGCRVLTAGFQQNSSYTSSVTNPVEGDESVNVSMIAPSSANPSVYFRLAENIPVNTILDWSARFYSENPGANGTGAGQIRITLMNNSLGAGIFADLGTFDKVGGEWQIQEGSQVTLTTSDDAAIDAAGGFDIIRIFSSVNQETLEDLYFDNIETSLNPNLENENADLLEGNAWVYNNREGDNQNEHVGLFNTTPSYNIATPSTDGNSASSVIEVLNGSGFRLLSFPMEAMDPPFSGTVKFRIYTENCNLNYANNVRIRLLKDFEGGSQFYTNTASTVQSNIWTEVSYDLSSLLNDGNEATGYNRLQIIFDQGDNGNADGTVYYLDAIQAPSQSALSVESRELVGVKIYNSASNQIRIQGVTGKVQISMFNILGKRILEDEVSSNGNIDLGVPNLHPGLYIIQMKTEKGSLNKKIIIDP